MPPGFEGLSHEASKKSKIIDFQAFFKIKNSRIEFIPPTGNTVGKFESLK